MFAPAQVGRRRSVSSCGQEGKRRHAVSDYYTPELADELIVSHNNGVRRRAGISTEEAAVIDKQPPGPRQSAP